MTKVNFEIERLEGRGITAKVVNSERVYTTYRGFAKAAGYPEAAVHVWTDAEAKSVGADKIVGKSVKVLAKGKHEDHGGAIYVVESEDGERFLFGEKGLEIIEKGDCNMTKINLDGMSHVEMIGIIEEIVKRIKTESFSDGYDAAMMTKAKKLADDTLKETPRAREILDEAKPVIERARKTAQERRDRIVEQAKEDVEVLKDDYDGLYSVSNPGSIFHPYACTAEFFVNKEKRTVVSLLRGKHSQVIRAKGIAKCAPDDCFNVHIGKAIALRRALGLEVPAEYINAPQPTEVRVGDVIRNEFSDLNGNSSGKFYDSKIRQISGNKVEYEDGYYDLIDVLDDCVIIDDSREGVSE